MIDETSARFGLPDSMMVPIAARNSDALEIYVGKIVKHFEGRHGRVNALLLAPHDWPPNKETSVPLWSHGKSREYEQRLHPEQQVWVHVDYTNYRQAYIRLGMPEIPPEQFLDHIQNREAIRLRGYSHPYLRLCPVSRQVNTSGGHITGGEGMEKEFLRTIDDQHEVVQNALRDALDCEICYADPMDLTKMLDIPPGTQNLGGVGAMLQQFYAQAGKY